MSEEEEAKAREVADRVTGLLSGKHKAPNEFVEGLCKRARELDRKMKLTQTKIQQLRAEQQALDQELATGSVEMARYDAVLKEIRALVEEWDCPVEKGEADVRKIR